ncbi:PEP-CTERM sorting domain-containing protein [candidate division KSB1 bacterium]|nr:PEP-CTERM sorting domain-containing protein [candidate division KSB1 bacterium]
MGEHMKHMMLSLFVFMIVLLALGGVVDEVFATALTLNYQINTIHPGLYDYEFSLVLDNHDNTWAPGQGWRWFIFGDSPTYPSPLTNFIGDFSDLPVGPWTYFTTSKGSHNGPTFGPVINYWIPTFIGESLSWSGTSTAYLAQGELLFSTLGGTLNGALSANFETANLVETNPVPEPNTLILIGSGLLLICFWQRRKLKN